MVSTRTQYKNNAINENILKHIKHNKNKIQLTIWLTLNVSYKDELCLITIQLKCIIFNYNFFNLTLTGIKIVNLKFQQKGSLVS